MMNFLLFITPILTIDWGSINWEIVGLIFTIGVPIISFLYFLGRKILKSSSKQEKKRIESFLMHPHEVKPTDIMGDRGEIKYGYREDSWYERKDLEQALINSVQSSNSCVTVITGKFASGKSRLVHHYLTSEDCQFKWVYAPKTSINKTEDILSTIKSRFFKAADTLLVLDDIDNLYQENADKDLGLGDLMKLIHHKKIKTIITGTEGTYRFDDFKKNCKSSIFKGRDASHCDIKFIEIQDIKKGDDCYNWCFAELNDEGFSTVIGGYVFELSSEISGSIGLLSDDDKKSLVTHYVSTKFRHHEGKNKEVLQALHQQLWPEATNESFDKSLGHLVKIGFLNAVLKGDDDNEIIYYHIANPRLYNSFIGRCVFTNDNENPFGKKLRRYTQRTEVGEQQQIDCYLNMDANRREKRLVNYSRVISHSIFESSIDYVWKRMKKEFKLSTQKAPNDLYFSIGDIIRRKHDGLELAKDLINKRIIEPREIIISNLLIRTRDRAQAIEYANTLPHINDENAETIFYLRCKELSSPNFDDNRVRRAQQLFIEQLNSNTDKHFTKTNYITYCDSILKKAISGNRINEFWTKLTTVWHIQLLLNKNSLKHFFETIGANNPNDIKDKLILNAYNIICENWEHIQFYNKNAKRIRGTHFRFMAMTQVAIAQCKSLDSACIIYEYFKTQTADNHQLANRVSFQLFEKIKPIDCLDRVRNVLVERITEEKSPEICYKMVHKYLEHMSCLKMVLSEIDMIKKASQWQGSLINRDGINAMLKVLRDSIHNGKFLDENQIELDLDAIIDIQEKNGFIPTPHFNTLLYSCAQELILKNASTRLIEKVRASVKRDISYRNVISTEEKLVLDKSERARIASIIDIDEAINVTDDCIRYINEKSFLPHGIITNVIQMYFNSFKNKEHEKKPKLKNKIITLIAQFDERIKTLHPYYCKQKMRFMISEQPQNINEIIKYIEDCFQQLTYIGYIPNIEKQDLYQAAIHDANVCIDDAFTLLKAAAIHPDQYTDSATYNPYIYYFKASLISLFLMKLKKYVQKNGLDENHVRAYVDETQQLINKHPYLSYVEVAGSITAIVRSFGIRDMKIYFPIISTDASVRHEMWDYYTDRQELYKLDDSTITRFIKQELLSIKINKNPAGDYYIKRAQEELDSRKSIVEKPVDNSLDNSGAEVSQGEEE